MKVLRKVMRNKRYFFLIFLFSLKCWPCMQYSPPWNKSNYIISQYRFVKDSEWIAFGTITYSSSFHKSIGECSPSSLEVKVKLDNFVKGFLSIKEIRTFSHKEGFYDSKPIPIGTKMIVIGGKTGVKAFEVTEDSDSRYLQNLVLAAKELGSKVSIFNVVASVKDENTVAMQDCYKKNRNQIAECAEKVKHPQVAYPYIFWSDPITTGISSKYCEILGYNSPSKSCLSSAKQRAVCDPDGPTQSSNDNCRVDY